MDWQYLFNLLAGGFGAICLYLLRSVSNDINTLRENIGRQQDAIGQMQDAFHDKFVRRDDFKSAIERIEAKLDKLFERLDSKADRE